MTDVPLSLNLLNGRKDTYFPSDRLSGQMKAKGKTHVCFPNRRLFQSETALQAVLSMPRLTSLIWGCQCVLSMCLLRFCTAGNGGVIANLLFLPHFLAIFTTNLILYKLSTIDQRKTMLLYFY